MRRLSLIAWLIACSLVTTATAAADSLQQAASFAAPDGIDHVAGSASVRTEQFSSPARLADSRPSAERRSERAEAASCVETVPGASVPAAEHAPSRRFIAADSSRSIIAIVNADNSISWQRRIGPLHDLHVLPNGNVLFQDSWTHVLEVNPATDETVWEYDATAAAGNAGRRIEIHAFQRLENGTTMIVESGRARILELDRDNNVVAWIPLKVEHPDAHRDTRLVRNLPTGNYLACHEGDGAVREYDPTGKVVWEFRVPLYGRQPADGHGVEAFGNQCFSAIRLANGNTLIGTGNGHSVIEVTPAGQDVWSLHQNDLPGIQLAWVTSLQVLPGGNILINNCHAGPENPQLIEIDRDKRVVWSFRDFDRFGDSLTNSQILEVDGKPVAGRR